MSETPFEGGGFLPPVRGTEEEAARARIAVCAATALEALGLIPYRDASSAAS